MDSAQLPHLEEVYSSLKQGRHITGSDALAHQSIRENFEQYRALFIALGYKLTRHRQDFYYLSAGPNSSAIMQKYAAFYFIFLDHLADHYGTVSDSLFNQRFPLVDLPHLKVERYKRIMADLKVNTDKDLENLVNRLQGSGFLHINKEKVVVFDSPSHRFLDMCHDLVNTPQTSDLQELEPND